VEHAEREGEQGGDRARAEQARSAGGTPADRVESLLGSRHAAEVRSDDG
jgi:hypothetical protein